MWQGCSPGNDSACVLGECQDVTLSRVTVNEAAHLGSGLLLEVERVAREGRVSGLSCQGCKFTRHRNLLNKQILI